jgi:membrane fusion protein, multidrug efflux system
MIEKQSAYSDESTRIETGPRAEEAASVEQGTKSLRRDSTLLPADRRPRRKRTLLLGVLGALVLAGMWLFGVPWIQSTLNTVSTDDAYVNGHVTFVAARVSGQVTRVLVDDNNRVHKGDLLVQLDREPYEDAVAVKRAAVDTAKADLQTATATVRGLEAQARGLRWKLKYAMEDVDNRVALLHSRVAALDKNKATLKLAQVEFHRAEQLLPTSDISREDYDRRQATLSVAQAEVTQAMADVNQIRLSLGLAAQPEGGDLAEVPPHLDQTFSSVLEAQAALIQTAAQLGVIHSYEQSPRRWSSNSGNGIKAISIASLLD